MPLQFDDFSWVYGQNIDKPAEDAKSKDAEGAADGGGNSEAGANQPAGAAGGSESSGLFGMEFLLLMGLVFIAFIFFTRRGEKRKRTEQEALFSGLEKGQKVMLKSGLYGKVEKVNKDEQEIQLVVDESKNVIMTFSLMAVADVIKEEKSSVKKEYN